MNCNNNLFLAFIRPNGANEDDFPKSLVAEIDDNQIGFALRKWARDEVTGYDVRVNEPLTRDDVYNIDHWATGALGDKDKVLRDLVAEADQAWSDGRIFWSVYATDGVELISHGYYATKSLAEEKAGAMEARYSRYGYNWDRIEVVPIIARNTL